MLKNRRSFIVKAVLGSAALAAGTHSLAADAPKVGEADPQAAALGYKLDATAVDKVKFAKYVAGQKCEGCGLYQGKAGEAYGPCLLFAGKQVSAAGWCSAFVKKAA